MSHEIFDAKKKRARKIFSALKKTYPHARIALRYANPREFEMLIRQTGFYHAKAKAILASAKIVKGTFGGRVPKTMEKILTLRGVARKSANVVLGNAYGVGDGIAVDTHVRRLSQRMGCTKIG